MDERTANTSAATENIPASIYDDAVRKCTQIMREYWEENPDLHRIVQQKKQEAAMAKIALELPENKIQSNQQINPPDTQAKALWDAPLRGAKLCAQIRRRSGLPIPQQCTTSI